MLTEHQLEIAALKLCESCGGDPETWLLNYAKTVISEMINTQAYQAIAYAVAQKEES